MTLDDLAEIHLASVSRYAQIFMPNEADAHACGWWEWAHQNLNRQLYEEVRKKRWKSASKIEKIVAKQGVPDQ